MQQSNVQIALSVVAKAAYKQLIELEPTADGGVMVILFMSPQGVIQVMSNCPNDDGTKMILSTAAIHVANRTSHEIRDM